MELTHQQEVDLAHRDYDRELGRALQKLAKEVAFVYGINRADEKDYHQELIIRALRRAYGSDPRTARRFRDDMTSQASHLLRGDSFSAPAGLRSPRPNVTIYSKTYGNEWEKRDVSAEFSVSPLSEEEDDYGDTNTTLLDTDRLPWDRDEEMDFHWSQDLIQGALTARQYQFFLLRYAEGGTVASAAREMDISVRAAEMMDARVKGRIKITIESQIQERS